jgi:uncharacterized membrane protein
MIGTRPLPDRKTKILILAGVICLLTGAWLALTPAGLMGKLSALGFAFCHQIASHTLQLDGRYLPLCARCTGMYLGTLVGLALLTSSQRAGGFPERNKGILLGGLALLFVVDGVNSLLATLHLWNGLYEPSNLMRLFTGLGMGMVISNLLYPIWNNVLWIQYSSTSA